MKRKIEDSEWTENFSTKYKRKYWFSKLTGKSVWEDPTTTDSTENKDNTFVDNTTKVLTRTHSDFITDLQSEYNELPNNNVSDKDGHERCPRLLETTDLHSLLARLRKEIAGVVSSIPTAEKPDFKIVFSLPNDDTAIITRAIQEEEILKTRLKVYDKSGVVDLPSFWDVWRRPDRKVASKILQSADPNEMKWQLQREESVNGKGKYQYKLATTFMPAYAKQIYTYFQAKRVLDPCSGWGDRMLGAAATADGGNVANYTGIERYIGFDPNRHLRLGYAKILELCGAEITSITKDSVSFSNNFEINTLPFEVGAKKLEVKSIISFQLSSILNTVNLKI